MLLQLKAWASVAPRLACRHMQARNVETDTKLGPMHAAT